MKSIKLYDTLIAKRLEICMFRIGFNYKTPAAERAIHNLKVSIKKQTLTLEDFITKSSPELKAKKEYMQTDEFWKDKHNEEMFSLYEKMINDRDKITKNINMNNSQPNAEIQAQGINGIARVKKYLDKNPELNFWKELSFNDEINSEYKFTQMKIYNLARDFKSKIGR